MYIYIYSIERTRANEYVLSKRLKHSALMVGSWMKSNRVPDEIRERVPDCGAATERAQRS